MSFTYNVWYYHFFSRPNYFLLLKFSKSLQSWPPRKISKSIFLTSKCFQMTSEWLPNDFQVENFQIIWNLHGFRILPNGSKWFRMTSKLLPNDFQMKWAFIWKFYTRVSKPLILRHFTQQSHTLYWKKDSQTLLVLRLQARTAIASTNLLLLTMTRPTL